MKKFYTEPIMGVNQFETENIVTVSGAGTATALSEDELISAYAVKTIDVRNKVDFTF